jgi:GTP pyrophosphokinase
VPDKQDLIEKVKLYDPNANLVRLARACDFSKEKHGTQKRASGEPYYSHPLEVAHILADMHLDLNTIITALLHDTVEDTDVTLDELEREFGEEIRSLVDGVTKLTKLEGQSEQTKQAENFRKLLMAMSEDIRVLLVKLADRLHNMRTLHFVKSPKKRLRIARETMDVYSSLAERIGMQSLKNEMQDLAFAELHPEVRESIISRLEYLKQKDGNLIKNIVDELGDAIKKTIPDSNFDIQGREKSACSIWRKMDRKNINFEKISDIMAFRILTDKAEECYQLLGIIHSNYKMVPDSFKDFISTPKENGYQSLHTVVMGPGQKIIEIQIRTKEMHEVAELGVAAHWTYKQGRDYSTDGKQYKWVRELLYILEHTSDPEEFMENTKLEMHYDQVFCFTPKGDLVALPKGATPVDFAYEVHSKVGNKCTGAKVNGRIVPLRVQLNNGDQVEIITSKTQVPSPSWESFVVTGKAKSEIKRFVRIQKRAEYIKLGQSILIKTSKEAGLGEIEDQQVNDALEILRKKSTEDVYAAIGEGLVPVIEVMRALYPDKKISTKKSKNPLSMLLMYRGNKHTSESLPIKGLIPDMAVYFAECCHPIPGDRIVGVVTTGKGMTIHTSDCEMLSNFSSTPERLVDVSWGKETGEQAYIGRIKVTLAHEAGALGALANIIAQEHGNINNLKISDRSPEFFVMIVDVVVKGDTHLSSIITSLRADKRIHSVSRFKH